MANRNWASGGRIYSMRVSPVQIDCNFQVDQDDTAGLGITNLRGPAVEAVIMNSSAATPSSPNPDAGSIIVRLQDNYNRVIGMYASIQSPLLGSPSTSTVAGDPVVITSLGTATAAQSLSDFQAKGLPRGITPAIGVSFVPTASGVIGHSAAVDEEAALGSGVASIEILGNPELSLAPNPSANQGFGAEFILQCRDYAGAIVQPAEGSAISLVFMLDNSSVQIP